MSRLILITLCCAMLHAQALLATASVTVDDIALMTEEYPPYSYKSEGQIKGIAVDVMVLMLEKMKAKKSRSDIELLPWARAYRVLEKTPNTCLFLMTQTQTRSKLFKMVGPLLIYSSSVLAKKSRKFIIRSYKDLLPYKVGILRDDIVKSYFEEHGLAANIIEVSSPDSLARMLASDRIDMWAYGDQSQALIMKRNKINFNDFESVFSLPAGGGYYAFNRSTPDDIVKKFQKAFDALVNENRIEAIIQASRDLP